MTADAPDKNENKIQLTRIAHVYYRYASQDIQAAHEFMQDFGFFHVKSVGPRTYYRGYGPEPFVLCVEEAAAEDHTNSSNTDNDSRPKTGTQFGGAAFAVASLDELEKATRVLPPEARATSVYELKDAPGGGKCVSFWDPVDGFPFHLVWGQTLAEPIDLALPEPKTNFVG
ncbi:hypothetical protein BD289DRAFT_487078 [Coniella lustricola]|uniref:VOC domain-containing protein n=1 Tax=Coniella lustricola TaxID=2025994 RepID=A0A2T2ZSY7_9PEZI|nr:hypothetical protein BD289DRAFT_487078 [Coniella lustricola]